MMVVKVQKNSFIVRLLRNNENHFPGWSFFSSSRTLTYSFWTSNTYIIGWQWQRLYLWHKETSHIGWLTMTPSVLVVITTTYMCTYVIIFYHMVMDTFCTYVVLFIISVDDYVCVWLLPSHFFILYIYVGLNQLFSGFNIFHYTNIVSPSLSG